jgi:hypothetical protein
VGAAMMPLFRLFAPRDEATGVEVLEADEEWNRQHGLGSQTPYDPRQPRWPQGWQ